MTHQTDDVEQWGDARQTSRPVAEALIELYGDRADAVWEDPDGRGVCRRTDAGARDQPPDAPPRGSVVLGSRVVPRVTQPRRAWAPDAAWPEADRERVEALAGPGGPGAGACGAAGHAAMTSDPRKERDNDR